MKFIDIFNKEFLVEENHLRKELKIFYEIDLNIIKPKTPEEKPEQPAPEAPQETPAPENTQIQEPVQQEPAPEAMPAQETPAPEQEQNPEDNNPEQPAPQTGGVSLANALASVVTEDEVAENSDNKIVRKMEGEVKLSDKQKDNTQSFVDLLSILRDTKKDGMEILDDFSSEIIELCSNQRYNDIKAKVDKESKIYFELYFGYTKDDSVGVRFNKRANSDTMTYTMMIDNEIVSAKFDISKIDQKIAEYRNYEAKKH